MREFELQGEFGQHSARTCNEEAVLVTATTTVKSLLTSEYNLPDQLGFY